MRTNRSIARRCPSASARRSRRRDTNGSRIDLTLASVEDLPPSSPTGNLEGQFLARFHGPQDHRLTQDTYRFGTQSFGDVDVFIVPDPVSDAHLASYTAVFNRMVSEVTAHGATRTSARSVSSGQLRPRRVGVLRGQFLAIADNNDLFNLIGTTYGGDGETTFALPDLRGRVPIHQFQGPSLSSRVLGESGGVEAVTLTVQQIPIHTHPLVASTDPATDSPPPAPCSAATSPSTSTACPRPSSR